MAPAVLASSPLMTPPALKDLLRVSLAALALLRGASAREFLEPEFSRDVLKCSEALLLDGTINSLHSTELKRSDFRMDLGPIIGIAD